MILSSKTKLIIESIIYSAINNFSAQKNSTVLYKSSFLRNLVSNSVQYAFMIIMLFLNNRSEVSQIYLTKIQKAYFWERILLETGERFRMMFSDNSNKLMLRS